jgi:hypothetical protein
LQGLKPKAQKALLQAVLERMSLGESSTAGDFMRTLGLQGYDSLTTPIRAASPLWVLEQAAQTASAGTVYEYGTVEAVAEYFGIALPLKDLIKSEDYLSVASSEDSVASSEDSVASSEDSLSVASSEDSTASSKDSTDSESVASSTKSSVSYHKAPNLLSLFTHHASPPIPHSLPTLPQTISVADSDVVTSFGALMQEQKKAMEKKGAKFSKKDLVPINSNSKTLRKAKSAREPIPGKNLFLSAKEPAVVCGFHKVPLSVKTYTADRPGAVAHHFCFRERGEDIPKGCRGIASAYIIKYINKNYDATVRSPLP